LYTICELIDLQANEAYVAGGLPALEYWLQTSDSAEHMLARIGAEVALIHTGDLRAFHQLLTSRPPGGSDILPQWALTAARDYSKQITAQAERAKKGRTGATGVTTASSSDDDGKPKKRRPRPKKKGLGGGGGDGGGAGGGGAAAKKGS